MYGLKKMFEAFAEYIEEEREYTGEGDDDGYFADKVAKLECIYIEASKDLERITESMLKAAELLNDENDQRNGTRVTA